MSLVCVADVNAEGFLLLQSRREYEDEIKIDIGIVM